MFYFKCEVIKLVITSITKQKRNENRFNIFIDGDFSFSASGEDILKHSIKEGLELNEESFNCIRFSCEFSKAYNYGLCLLETRNHTSEEISRKLRRRDYSEKTIEDVLEKLKSYKFIDDNEYTEKYIRDCLNFKKYGKKKIMYNLKNKGVDSILINNADFDFEIQYENACILAEKKLKLLMNKPNQKEKVFQYLASRGYEFGLINKVINKVFNDAHEYETNLDD
jgi:regulatory protein